MKKTLRTIVLVAVASAAASAQADPVVWDQGPGTGTYNSGYVDIATGQNYADSVTFDAATVVTGMNFYSGYDLTRRTAGDAFHLKVLADDGGAPGAALHTEDIGYAIAYPFEPQVNLGMQELHFEFAPMTFSAGMTYWIGLSGNGFDAGQDTIDAPQDDAIAMFDGDAFVALQTGFGGLGPIGDQMYQLTGHPAVPELGGRAAIAEPAYPLLLGSGLALLALVARRRR
ncbi:MAG: hypothetical protein ABW032_02060 [Burkholderiaceae bacterium]